MLHRRSEFDPSNRSPSAPLAVELYLSRSGAETAPCNKPGHAGQERGQAARCRIAATL